MARVLVIGDTHCPGMRTGYIDFLKRVADSYAVTRVVHIGDLVDWASISYHEKSPSLRNATQEYGRAKRQVAALSRAFPKADWLIGNHDALTERQTVTAGLPPELLRDYADMWNVDWQIHPRFTKLLIDGVIYSHGDSGRGGQDAAFQQARDNFRSTVIGHFHNQAGVRWWANPEFRVFGLSVGCGIDARRMQFEYGRKFAHKPLLGCGIVVGGITPALPLFAMLRDYSLATLDAAKAAAYYAGIIYTDAPPNGETDPVEALDPIELDRNMLLTMPGGWKMAQLHAEQPTGTYAEFKREILNEIARCLNMPFNIAAGNSSSYNYASGRLDHQTYFKQLRIDQARIETVVLDRMLAAWFDEAVLVDGLLPSGLGPIADWPHQWFWDGHEHVDPQKEATAQATRLASHTTTLADEYARKGQDWESQLRQRAKELALMTELGLNLGSPTSTFPTEAPHAQPDDEEPVGDE